MKQFIRIRDRVINLDQVSYVEFLDSGRAMIYLPGLPGEKSHIQVEASDASRLKALFDKEGIVLDTSRAADPPGAPSIAPPLFPRRY